MDIFKDYFKLLGFFKLKLGVKAICGFLLELRWEKKPYYGI